MTASRRLVIALTGASGAIYGVRLLSALAATPDVETHLVVTAGAQRTLFEETDLRREDLAALADVVHRHRDLGAPIASGSFRTDGMVVAPCSIKTLSAVATCYSANLVARAADVTLKERRPLILMVREAPLHRGHLRLMADAAAMGATIFPPVPAFYARPASVEELVDHSVARVLDQLGIETDLAPRWQGPTRAERAVRTSAETVGVERAYELASRR